MAELIKVDTPPPAARPPLRHAYLVRGTIAPHFVEAGALSPQDAISFRPRSAREAKRFTAMRRASVIRRTEGGYWLDIVSYQADQRLRTRRAVPYLILGAVALAMALTFFYRG